MNVFINLLVADLERSRAFFTALGFTFNDDFSDEMTLGMEIGGNCYSMLVTRERFATFTLRPPADAHETTEVLVSLQLESREAVDAFMETALAHGAEALREPQDYGFMYSRDFADLDGHIWEPFWLDPAAAAAAAAAAKEGDAAASDATAAEEGAS